MRSTLVACALVVPILCAAAAPAEAQGTGVYGEYFDNLDFVTPPASQSRIDATINFNWGAGALSPPFNPGIDALPPGITAIDTWSARWSGVIETPPVTGVYQFQTVADDGIRVYVNGRLLIDRWRDQSALLPSPPAPPGSVNYSTPSGITLVGGQRYGIRVEYFENPGDMRAQLLWNVPGSGAFVVVPQSALFPDVAAPKISPAAGTYSDSVTVTMVCDTFGAEIRFTTDGTVPNAGSTLYTGPIVLVANTTPSLRAIGLRPGTLLNPSAVTTAVYTINDILRPTIVTAQAPIATQVVVVFSEALALVPAQTAANYTLTPPGGAGTVTTAVLSGDLKTVFLTLSGPATMTPGNPYALTVSNLTDRAVPTAHTIVPGSGIAFVFPAFASAVNYYPFEEGAGTTTADLGSAAANPNTLSGVTGLPAWIIGYLGRGLNFDGVDDSVALAASLTPILGGSDATLACWVRTEGQGNLPVRAPGIAGGLIAPNATDPNNMFWGWLDENGRIGITAGDTIDFATNPEPVPPNAQPNTAQSANPINDNQWHHVAFTRNITNGALQVYVDGILSGSGTGQTGALTTVCQTIGRITGAVGSAGHPVYFLGDLDDLRIFGSVLTQPQIQSLANRAPAVNAGADQSVDLGQAAALNGIVTDDGFPTPSTIIPAWSGSGPGTIMFTNANAISTTATFSTPGIYILRLTVSDGQLATSDELIVSYGMITVTPLSIQTTEAGGSAMFSVVLNVPPLGGSTVTIPVSSTNTAEGTVSTASLVFAASGAPQFVTVTGVDDTLIDGNIAYTIVLGPAVSTDPAYSGYNPSDVQAVNINDDFPPPLKRVWGNCGLAGAEILLPLGLLALRRRRRLAPGSRSRSP